MCIKGKKGLKINSLKTLINKFEYFFGEDQGRYIIEISKENSQKVNEILNNNSVHFDDLGVIEGKSLTFNDDINLPIEELSNTHTYWLQRYMNN
jgi:Phosphoribosylformylglycinamidine (FGAM) synthase, synthetase domain